jgi:tRNA (adenine58-N1)-methyltransferase non-catalytic subunit
MSWAILQELGGKKSLIQLRNKIKIGKQIVQLSSAIDFNKTYKITNGLPEEVPIDSSTTSLPGSGNNKDFFDNNTAQSLDQSQILEIRTQQGGDAVVEQLVQNSSTFTMKSSFAQEKYIKKKKNKHLSLFTLIKPTAGGIADVLYANRPQKSIRSDALFNVLALSNVHYFAKVLLQDHTGGVILGAVLERTSVPVTVIMNEKVKDHALKYFNIRTRNNEQIVYKPIADIDEEFDSMIIAAKSGLAELFKLAFGKLRPAGTFVAYQQDVVDAAKTYDWIMSEGIAANVVIEEIWSREFQVLAERTHPDMKDRIGTSGGYLVSGVKFAS